ncbi:malonate decarboxylase holo-[acyl-carrier-protein] synthase [Pseudorhodoferax sp.]|uniref:malonate decarboxylase holo-[acyl-carrier-protein] synthase n=1 Tax=Pseudorhodoferax sp. TaxID=1993553 RepID=UPI002DD68C9F|nr:malonate decarboxylase holo-[acyl-carrier-protein] synthase [Pseudorhodoferax sp.]
MTTLHRHQLVRLTEAGWRHVLAGAWDAQAQACLAHWAQQRLPLVVTRQRPQADGAIGLGLPAPNRWECRRIALAVPKEHIARFDTFPPASALAPLLGTAQRRPWRALCGGLSACGVAARVYGSHGWQLLTGLDHLRPGSDIDLHIAVDGPAQADAVAVLLQSWSDGLRLDGELVFAGDRAVAWREWLAWRAGRAARVLVKRLDGVALADAPFWPLKEAA